MAARQRVARSKQRRQPLGVPASIALECYRTMLRIRRVQEALIREYHPAAEMRCPMHFCVGQEAPPAALCLTLKSDDDTFTGHRSHGYYLAKGGSLRGMFAEFFGKVTGSNGGKAGSQELSDEAAHFYSGTILATTLAIAAGVALARQMRGERRVVTATFGDGGADEGVVYETLNFAALKRLPIVFVCENNLYSTYSRQSTRQPIPNIAERAAAFGVPSRRMFGNDVLAVFRASAAAVARARKGHGPSLLELETYRWCGHVGPENDDHLEYRTPDELAAWRKRCPIALLERRLRRLGLLDKSRIDALETEISHEIADAFAFARSSPFPGPEALMRDIFAEKSSSRPVGLTEFIDHPFDFQQPEAVPRPY